MNIEISKIDYEALTENSEVIKGQVKGNLNTLKQFIKTNKLTLIDYKVVKEKLKGGKFKNSDFLSLVEELYYLLSSGMKIDDSLKLLIRNSTKESSYEFLSTILNTVSAGEQLSVSISNASKKVNYNVSKLAVSVIKSGEDVGNLSFSLKTLIGYLQFNEKITSEIKQALSYPIFLTIMSISMVYFVFIVIVPKFTTIFTAEEIDRLPTISKWLMKLGIMVDSNLSLVLMSTLGFILISPMLVKILLKYYRFYILNVPIISNLVVTIELSRIFNSISMLLQGGVGIDKALRQSTNLSVIPEIQTLLKEGLASIKKGEKLSDSFASNRLIPPYAISMINVGENSAKLSEIFMNLSTRFADEFSIKTKKLLSLLEPIVIVIMGFFIAFIVISIMLAVISLNEIA